MDNDEIIDYNNIDIISMTFSTTKGITKIGIIHFEK